MVLSLTTANLPSPMELALDAAQSAADQGEVPVGAVLIDSRTGKAVSTTHNYVESWKDATAHAEMLAIQDACQKLGATRLQHCDLYVTLEPCPMCAGAISHARIRKLVFGAYDPKSGGVEHGARVFEHPQAHHKPEVIGGVEETRCSHMLQTFFQARR
ncbi:MAG: nucleoside deaminase [Alphaproteobacteria bacterium]